MQPLFSGFFRLFSSGSSISYAASRRMRRKSISFSNWDLSYCHHPLCHSERSRTKCGEVEESVLFTLFLGDGSFDSLRSLRMTVVVVTRLRRFEQYDKLKFTGPAAKSGRPITIRLITTHCPARRYLRSHSSSNRLLPISMGQPCTRSLASSISTCVGSSDSR